MFCTNCGKELPEGAAFCTECGMPINGSVPSVQPSVSISPVNPLCIIGLVISCISIFYRLWGLAGIAGIIISSLGVSACARKKERGKAAGIVGIVLGSLSVLIVLFWVFGILSCFYLWSALASDVPSIIQGGGDILDYFL